MLCYYHLPYQVNSSLAELQVIISPRKTNTVFPFHANVTGGTDVEPITIPDDDDETQEVETNKMKLPKIKSSRSTGRSPLDGSPSVSSKSAHGPRRKAHPLGGKPGDTPTPGFDVAKSLSGLAARETPRRPQTTPSRPSPRANTPRKPTASLG